jgi:hypothetical protein
LQFASISDALTWDLAFNIANTIALASWVALVFLPRWPSLLHVLRYGVLTLLSIAYVTIIFAFFFRIEGGGFMSLEAIKALFVSDALLVAGWLHYLAFDLFVGLWIASACDRLAVSRLIQAPILLATFMFGPLGLLLYTIFIDRFGSRRPAESRN